MLSVIMKQNGLMHIRLQNDKLGILNDPKMIQLMSGQIRNIQDQHGNSMIPVKSQQIDSSLHQDSNVPCNISQHYAT